VPVSGTQLFVICGWEVLSLINLSVIKNISWIKKCARGTIITGPGSNHAMFVVLKGEIGVFADYQMQNSKALSILGSGELFADAALFLNKKAAYTTVALSDAIILPVNNGNALDFIQAEPALALEMIKDLCLRLDEASAAAQQQVLRQTGLTAGQVTDSFNGSAVPAAPRIQPPLQDARPFSLYPEEHGCYQLNLNDPGSPYLMDKAHTCPVCHNQFTVSAVRPSKLAVSATDPDLRCRYKHIEPLYYEVVTCPHCLYSALPDIFDTPDKPRQDLQRELAQLKKKVNISFEKTKTADLVFAGFYLALFCAPLSFKNDQLLLGRLLYKLSRVYNDAGDMSMERITANKALEHFLSAYAQIQMPQSLEQQVCVTVAELYLKQNDLRNSLTFFAKAKSIGSSLVLKNHADDRIHEIRAKVSERRL
jgi:uncharacterized protein (DUF2225 family)